jgi:hypothetical protein
VNTKDIMDAALNKVQTRKELQIAEVVQEAEDHTSDVQEVYE